MPAKPFQSPRRTPSAPRLAASIPRTCSREGIGYCSWTLLTPYPHPTVMHAGMPYLRYGPHMACRDVHDPLMVDQLRQHLPALPIEQRQNAQQRLPGAVQVQQQLLLPMGDRQCMGVGVRWKV